MEALSLPYIGLNKDDPRLQLKVENRMKNIFVTQIEETRYEMLMFFFFLPLSLHVYTIFIKRLTIKLSMLHCTRVVVYRHALDI